MARTKTRRDRSNERKLANKAAKLERIAQRERDNFAREFQRQLRQLAANGTKLTVNGGR